MYQFKRIWVPGFMLVESRPIQGCSHVKRFAAGTTPRNQGTLNLYLAGRFSFSISSVGFNQELCAGGSSLDLGMDAFPAGVDAIEVAISEDCWRMCLSPEGGASRWSRRIVELEPGGVLALVAGDLAVALLGVTTGPGGVLSPGSVIYATEALTLASESGARIAIARLL